jgi:type II secretory pathway pseudopilin PulG
MARALLKRLLHEEDGFTLTEQLVVSAGLVVILGAILGLSEVAIKQAPQDRERVHAVRDAQIAVDKMTRELRTAHAITVEPLKATASIYRNGTTITVTYDCSVSAGNGLRKCVRSQSGGASAPDVTAVERVANPASRPVFTATTRPDKDGVHWTTYVRTLIEVPSRGELKAGANSRIVLDDGFYLRNVDGLH